MEVKKIDNWTWAAYTDGREVARSGITECWPGRGYAWFYDKGLTKREWVQATKKVAWALAEGRRHFNRIEMAVYHNHPAGHKWAQKLGFRLEGQYPRYMPNGETGYVYVMFGEP